MILHKTSEKCQIMHKILITTNQNWTILQEKSNNYQINCKESTLK